MVDRQGDMNAREQEVIALTSFMVHKHYCENDVESLIERVDEDIIWFGAAEQEYDAGKERVASIFRQFMGKVPKCNISQEEYRVVPLAPEVYLCSGRMWIATDASTQISLRVHQRITTVFRWREGTPYCCHIHISNPYSDMTEDDVGFPLKMAQQSSQYLQEQIALQKKLIARQTEKLKQMSYEDALTGLYNRNKLNQIMREEQNGGNLMRRLGIVCLDLNGLKKENDQRGHSAGDMLICRTAEQLRQVFPGKVYRIGGDEFLVLDDSREEEEFHTAVQELRQKMKEHGISCSMGVSFRGKNCGVKEQFDEADQRMYQEKRNFYSVQEHDRRSR